MSDQETDNISSNAAEQEKNIETPVENTPEAEKEEYSNPNWRAFREARKKERLEKEAAEKKLAEREAEIAALKAAFEAALSKNTPAPQNNYYEEESEDEKIEKKVRAALEKKERELEEERQRYEQQTYPQKLKSTYQDFSTVVNEETLDYLEYHYPEVSEPLRKLPDGFDKWSHIYHAVKKFVPNAAQAKKDLSRVEANMQKPKTGSMPTPIPQTQLSSWREIEQKRAENWTRMQKAIKSN